jgi:hypothetical protein
MFQKQYSTKNEVSRKPMKPYSRAYMSSYDWTYTVLELVDYIESNLSLKKEGDDDWKLFQDYCTKNNLNWHVIKKMIGFTVVEKFNSEKELINCEDFKPLELRKDEINVDKNTEEGINPFENFESREEKSFDNNKSKEVNPFENFEF